VSLGAKDALVFGPCLHTASLTDQTLDLLQLVQSTVHLSDLHGMDPGSMQGNTESRKQTGSTMQPVSVENLFQKVSVPFFLFLLAHAGGSLARL
jgi:hypothetical protein